jgi:hypothetical protein
MRCLSAFSGGLDSILSVKIIQEQGIEVIPVCFVSPFFDSKQAKLSATSAGINNLEIINLGDNYLNIVKNPKYGYGRNLNPCIDCHAYMLNLLGSLLPKFKASFIITGEILGQRPKSQTKHSLNAVSRLCSYNDLIVRPLSQKLLPDTKPIREKWVDKSKLFGIHGRSRKCQIELARNYNLTDYPTPASGCLLTDEKYSIRLADLIKYDMYSKEFINFLKYGRHFRISPNTKLVLGRNENENTEIEYLSTNSDCILLTPKDILGPTGILNFKNVSCENEILLSCRILLRYINKLDNDQPAAVLIQHKNVRQRIIVKKLTSDLSSKYLIG